MNKLTYNGSTYEDQITSNAGRLDMSHSMVGETLSVDTLYMPIVAGDLPERFIAADQTEDDWFISADGYEICAKEDTTKPEMVSNGSGLYYFNDTLVGKYFLNELHQIAEYEHALTFYSAIKLLGRSRHLGGLYSGETVEDILPDLMGGIPYTVDGDVATIQVYGYLPYDLRRNNLQKLLMAVGGAVKNASDGSLWITSLSDTVAGTFDIDRVFVGGSVIDRNKATAVQVTEHNFIETSDVVTLYENSSVATETIYFNEPYHDYTIENGTIVSSGVNYVTFTGAGLVKITGKKHIHIQRIITVGTSPTGSEDDVVKTVTDNTLINPFNAVNVAQRLFDYLSVAQSIRAEVVFGLERPADVVMVVHPYTRQLIKATIKSMLIAMGITENRATSEFLVGYTPPSLISGFENHVLLTGTGSWQVPEGCTKIRAIMIGAGSGGSGGSGGNGGLRVESEGNASNTGGTGGEAGDGGRIFEINIVVTPGEILPFACGLGGNGGQGGDGGYGGPLHQQGSPGSAGTAGTETTLGIYSSEFGRAYPDGYQEPKTGLAFGVFGTAGHNGGKGGDFANPAENVPPYTGGAEGNAYTENEYHIPGGAGGGAAYGSNGENGGNAGYRESGGYAYLYTGDGGDGAAGINGQDGSTYGCGGSGGHGGGGGGHCYAGVEIVAGGTPGTGGSGSDGGKGGDGCIVIYY
jgi:hypothetical protein